MKIKKVKVRVMVEMPPEVKVAAEIEAERRGLCLSSLIRNYLVNFLPQNIEKSIDCADAKTAPQRA